MVYDVEVTETRKRILRVGADNRCEAKRIALEFAKKDLFEGIVYALVYKLGNVSQIPELH